LPDESDDVSEADAWLTWRAVMVWPQLFF